MARDEGSFLKGRVPNVDKRRRRIFMRAVQIARSKRNLQEVRAGTHVSSTRWKARYRGLTVQMEFVAYKGGVTEVSVRIRKERRDVFHLDCKRVENAAGRTARSVTVFTDAPGPWEDALAGHD
jgi:hypothetical protein